MVDGFIFGGRSTCEFAIHVEKYPKQNGPKRRRTTVAVPGRNGALHFQEDAFENYTQSYEIYFHGEIPTPAMAHEIKSWLLSDGSYQKLEDVYDPGYFRLATFAGPINVDNILNMYGRCTVNFDCAPQSFLTQGEIPLILEEATTLLNPTDFTALPLIRIYGNGDGTVTVGDVTVKLLSMEDEIVLDCEQMNAYHVADSGVLESRNSNIYAPEFPQLLPGENPVSWTGGVTKLEIIPRWWTL